MLLTTSQRVSVLLDPSRRLSQLERAGHTGINPLLEPVHRIPDTLSRISLRGWRDTDGCRVATDGGAETSTIFETRSEANASA